ncbi:MAG TPA: HPr family phosphocarrier protein [Acidimicrobiales bacterium]|jgi:phosphocarrier protein|nr:HPr family phosphocarrier protein [Acidimicrobiales bacterium]
MIERVVTVASASGLHARPARIFVKAAAALPVDVRLAVEGKKPVKAGSMLGVLTLGAVQGTEVTLSADDDPGGAGRAAVDELAELLATDLDAAESDA